jgi:hypothetical protein
MVSLEGFDWKSLKQDSLVVDVGGGVGSSTLHLIKVYPHLRYVIQDRPKVIADGVKVCLASKRDKLYPLNNRSYRTSFGKMKTHML